MPDTVWPIFDEALSWLESQRVIDAPFGRDMAAYANGIASTAVDDLLVGLDQRILDEIADSFLKGESGDQWRERMTRVTDITDHYAETLHRTFTHSAYHEGLRKVVQENDAAREAFPYVLYQATQDTRTRATHAALDGKVAHVDSPLAAEMYARVKEFGCRCSMSPLTREDAEEQGIDDDTGWTGD